jgi:hypothetical protein
MSAKVILYIVILIAQAYMWMAEVELKSKSCVCITCCNAPRKQLQKPTGATVFINKTKLKELISKAEAMLEKQF